MPSVHDRFTLVSDFELAGDQARAIGELVDGPRARRHASGAARRHRLGQDVHDGPHARPREPPDARDGPQQDARRPALSGIPPLLPAQRGRVLRQLLRLLPAGGLRPGDRLLHRERSDHQRGDRPHAAVGDAVALRAARRHHRRQRVVHLRPRLAGGVLRDAAAARARPADRARGGAAQAGRDPVRAQRSRLRPRHLPRPRRHHRGLSLLRGDGAAHRAVRRRGGRARLLRSAHRQDVPPARQDRRLSRSRTSSRRASGPSAPSRRSKKSWSGAAASSSRKGGCSKRSACTSARCSTSR